jgi:hypothetical protein
MIIICPPMPKVPDGATQEVREAMYQAYVAELRRANPQFFSADGKRLSWWRVLLGIFQ